MKTFIWFAIVLIGWCMPGAWVKGQALFPSVVATGGDHFSAPGFGTLEWTVGEVVPETFTNGLVLTQGFHQLYYTLVSVSPVQPDNLQILVYPNPFDGSLTVEVDPLRPSMDLSVYNLLGQRILVKALTEPAQTIDMDKLASGTYLLVIRQPAFICRALIVEKTGSTH